MRHINYQAQSKFINSLVFVFSIAFILLVNGAIPFVSMPTLGQAIWTTGFSQSFANQSIFDLHATNFGNPKPAAIAFGLAGAYPASLFIRAGLHPADAYTLMASLWLSIACLGTWRISKEFKLTTTLSALVSILWLSMPTVWWHANYSMLSLGIGLLPFYFYSSLRLFQCFSNSQKTSIRIAGLNLLAAIIAIFMDGYSFMMFAVGSSIVGTYMFLYHPEIRRTLFQFSFPIHIASFFFAYLLYAFYIGKPQFSPAPLDSFRGWGLDLMFLAAPTQGVHWLWDTLAISLPRTGREQFGDASVWATTFALPVIIVGMIAWWVAKKDTKVATAFLLVAFFGFYMGIGPSIKINSVKPEGIHSLTMQKEYAVASSGNAWLSKSVPGFRNMRAAYRWSALGFFGLWLLIVLLASKKRSAQFNRVITFSLIFLIASNLPNIGKKLSSEINFREDFFDIEQSLVKDLKLTTYKNERVAFLPYRNDFFVNYLASRAKINTYNIGGDKNLSEASKHWPITMGQFKMGTVDANFAIRSLLLLTRGEADAIVLPYIDLLWAAHNWPAPLKFKSEIMPVITDLRNSTHVTVDERKFYAIVRLDEKYNDRELLARLENQINSSYCLPPTCLKYEGTGKDSPLSQVGTHKDAAIHTNAKAGYLMFGPYQPMNAGEYILQISGKVISNSSNVTVDVAYHNASKVYARFVGLGSRDSPTDNVLLEERITLDEYVPALEVRVLVDKTAVLFINGYSLKPISTEKNRISQ